jgi:hypothetical protein
MELGRDITSQLKGQLLAEIAKVMEDCLNGRDEWLELSRSAVVNADAGNASHIEELKTRAFRRSRSQPAPTFSPQLLAVS